MRKRFETSPDQSLISSPFGRLARRVDHDPRQLELAGTLLDARVVAAPGQILITETGVVQQAARQGDLAEQHLGQQLRAGQLRRLRLSAFGSAACGRVFGGGQRPCRQQTTAGKGQQAGLQAER